MTKNSYDKSNVFAKLLRNEVKSSPVYESEHTLAFNDIYPCAPIHILVIPKGEFQNFSDFMTNASGDKVTDFWQTVNFIIKKYNLEEDNGYRIVTNCGINGGQTVGHFHVHIMAGKELVKQFC